MDYYVPMTPPKRLMTLALLMAAACTGALAAPAAAPPGFTNSNLDSSLFYELLVGELSAQSGDTASAYALMLDAARKARSPRLYERAVELALTARNGGSALQAAQAWAYAFPTSRDANRYVLQILIGLNKIPDTLPSLKRELALVPAKDRLATIALLPLYFARTPEKKLAARLVEKALEADLANPQSGPTAWATVGRLRLMADEAPGALEAARRGAALNPKAPEPILLALNLTGDQAAQAQTLVRKYLAAKPLPDIRMAYARKLLDTQRYADAYTQLQLLTTEKPDYADAWLIRGTLELQDKKLSAAQTSLKTYLTLAAPPPADATAEPAPMGRGAVQAYFLLAQIAEQNRQYNEALAYLKHIDSPADALRVQSRRAMILARQGRMDDARSLIRSTPELQPGDARAKISAEVQLLRDFKQYEAAYQVLAEAMARDPLDVDLVYDQAMVAEKLGHNDEMEQLLRKVIAAKPDYHHAYNALGYSLAERNVRLPEARQLIQKALEFAPNDPYILDSLAWVEYRSGNLPEAARLLQGAFAVRPDAEIAAHLGEVLWAMHQRGQASAVWNQGLALNPENETLLETMRRLSQQP